MSIMFNQICINEKMLAKYTHIYIHIHVYIYIYIHICIHIFIINSFRTIVFIVIVISRTFRPICPLTFFKCLSNSGTSMELRTTSFIESTGVTCSDSWVRQTPEEGQRTYRRKRCGNNNKDEDNSPKAINDKNMYTNMYIHVYIKLYLHLNCVLMLKWIVWNGTFLKLKL